MRLGEAPGLPALDVHTGRHYANAAAVCFEDQKHLQGVELKVKGVEDRAYHLRWPVVTEQTLRTHHDLQDATFHGAYAVAIMLAMEITGYTVVQQARKGSGVDYWLGANDSDLFVGARLEVSGILSGDESTIKSRIRQKKKQTKRSEATGLPAYACVVEFGRPEAHFVKQ